MTAVRGATPRSRASNRLPVRARLALWHVTAVAAVLTLFAIATTRHLRRTHAARIDASLTETADLVLQVLVHEAVDEKAPLDVAVNAGVRDVRYRDRRVVILDADGRVLARSDTTPLGDFSVARSTFSGLPALHQLGRARSQMDRAFASVGSDATATRILMVSADYVGAPITLLVARALHDGDDDNADFVRWLYWMMPLALTVAGGFGYLLVRQSLAPALAMARQAERISAERLDARLPVDNSHDELGQLGTVLNHLLGRLQASFSQQQRFMADASHELRTPIAVVRSAADVAMHDSNATPTALHEALNIVRNEGRRMTRIVDDLFLLARADSAQQPVHRERLFLEEVIADVAKAGRLLGRTRGITITANVADEAPFDGDATLLTRMLMNLVDNAIKFSPGGTNVRLHLGVTTSTSTGADTRDVYQIVVADDGPGIDPGLHATLFERFVRGDRSRGATDPTGSAGAGLGLAIARWIAIAHGGLLTLDTTVQRGAVFVIELPTPAVDIR